MCGSAWRTFVSCLMSRDIGPAGRSWYVCPIVQKPILKRGRLYVWIEHVEIARYGKVETPFGRCNEWRKLSVPRTVAHGLGLDQLMLKIYNKD